MYNMNYRPSIVQLRKKNLNDHGSAHRRESDNHGSENGQRNVPAMTAMLVFAYRRLRRRLRMVQVGDPLHEDYAGDYMPVSENVDVNADDEVDDVAFGTGLSTGLQHHDTRRDAINML
ncbi:hypothetical protein TIFTF001_049560 [Ficus carica]|uniref:Uncharacterized protein n=1 Tax=Ficus carica TaxID=3494 RepID=A0AA88CPH5_FICCA|nr:hypothetical protein TIFTF001_049548 [Ficus carica]GMN29618.1 hypothetical protein TIFTF001_049552 [Ficus carica]GMN29666.1 hypothetical protein TIFTF001_049556 [Ficus carica]GMN29679.1 hypothetical protein TIFTF001_049560 [Ficus carica]